MARIPVYSQGISARQGRGPGMAGGVPAVDGGGLALARAGAAISNIGEQAYNVEQRKQEEDAAAWSAEQLSKARLDWTQQQIEREQNAPAGAAGYAGQITKDFDTYTEELVKNAPTDKAREYLRNRMTDLKTGIVGRGMEFEARARLSDRIGKIDSAIDNGRIAVDLDPSQFQIVLAENMATLNALDIPETKKAEIRDTAQQQLSYASANARLRSDPASVMQQLSSEDGGGALDIRALNADNRLKLRNQAEAELKRREAEARQAAAISRFELQTRMADAQSAYLQGLQYEAPPTAGELIAAYGPEKGQAAYDRLLKTQQLGIDMREFATVPVEQRAEWLKQRSPAADGIAKEGFSEDLKLYGELVKNATNLNAQLAKDGAGYAVKYAPEVASAWEGVMTADADNAPASYQSYAEAALGEQQRLGVKTPSILPESYVSQVSAAFKDPANAGARQVQMINEMKKNWGTYFPQVFKQISTEVPDSVKVIGSLDADADTAALLSSIAPLKTSELKAPLPSADVNLMNTTLETALADFGKTLAPHGASGMSTYSSIYNEAYRGALAQMAQGVDPQKAAEDMSRRMTARYTRDTWSGKKIQMDGSLRVPNQWDIDQVQDGAEKAISRIDLPDVMIAQDIPGVSDDFKREQLRGILSAAQLVTNTDETGVRLFFNGDVIRRPDGSPLEMTFDELVGLSTAEE